MTNKKQYTNEEILRSLSELINQKRGDITQKDYQKTGRKPTVTTIIRRFGSWEESIKQAKEFYENKIKEEEKIKRIKENILVQLQECAKENNYFITQSIYRDSGRNPSVSTIVKYFGSWSKAIEEAKLDKLQHSILSIIQKTNKEENSDSSTTDNRLEEKQEKEIIINKNIDNDLVVIENEDTEISKDSEKEIDENKEENVIPLNENNTENNDNKKLENIQSEIDTGVLEVAATEQTLTNEDISNEMKKRNWKNILTFGLYNVFTKKK